MAATHELSTYDPEFMTRTCTHIIESGKSATSVGEELGIDKNLICKWVRVYRKNHKLPSNVQCRN